MESLGTGLQVKDVKTEHEHCESIFTEATDEQGPGENDHATEMAYTDFVEIYSNPTNLPDLRQILLQFQNDSYLCDTVLIGEDGQIRVHGIVLAAASPVFKAFLSSVAADSGDHPFVVAGVDVKILRTVVRFAYTGDVVVPKNDASTTELSRVISILHDLGFELPAVVSELAAGSNGRNDDSLNEVDTHIENENDITRCAEDTVNTNAIEAAEHQELVDEERLVSAKQVVKKKKKKKNKTDCSRPAGNSEKGNFSRICDRCGAEFNDSRHYQQHMHTHRQMKRVKCDKCNTWCSSLSNLRRHQFLHTGDRPYLCQHCGASFIQRPSLRAHIFIYHPDKAADFEMMMPNSNCNKKQHSFFKKTTLLRRMRKSTKVDDPSDLLFYHCNSCTRRFRSKASMLLHQRTHTDGMSSTKQASKIGQTTQNCKDNGYTCTTCNKLFRYPSELAQHESIAHGEDLQQRCPDCSFRCRYPTMLLKHYMKCHTGETTNRIVQCPVCGKKLANYIQEHMRTHTGERPFKCSVCGNSFRQSSHLVTHMRSHTGERPFSCELCDKSYKNKVDLRLHCRKVHDIELSKTPGRRPRMKNFRFD